MTDTLAALAFAGLCSLLWFVGRERKRIDLMEFRARLRDLNLGRK